MTRSANTKNYRGGAFQLCWDDIAIELAATSDCILS